MGERRLVHGVVARGTRRGSGSGEQRRGEGEREVGGRRAEGEARGRVIIVFKVFTVVRWRDEEVQRRDRLAGEGEGTEGDGDG